MQQVTDGKTRSYVAIDLGAGSGRLMLGRLNEGKLGLTEIHRFPNRPIPDEGHLRWDMISLLQEIEKGLTICARRYIRHPVSIGVDTWGVDFGIMNEFGEIDRFPISYRDPQVEGMVESFLVRMPRERLYELTGVQVIPINSVFQLHAMAMRKAEELDLAQSVLFIPDIVNLHLSGLSRTEFTFATTSQLFNPRTGKWEEEILERLGLSPSLMLKVVPPGSELGALTREMSDITGLTEVKVRAVASHDTASAVAAVPAQDRDFAYISSGTWSLVGFESAEPIITPEARDRNFSNEGGVAGTFRVLKNVTGLWLLDECRRAWAGKDDCAYSELLRRAGQAEPLRSLLNPDARELAYETDMPAAIAGLCRRSGQPVPEESDQFTRCILESLALAYRSVLEDISALRGKPVKVIHIVGGGSQNALLNQMTADATGLPVIAGPAEATAVGNLLVQAMADGEIGSLADLRQVVRHSFELKEYEPHTSGDWDRAYERFRKLIPR